jgi:hypothetical protein
MTRIVQIKITRTYAQEQTLGEATLSIDGIVVLNFKTLELPWLFNQSKISCIPEGNYKIATRTSDKYKRHLHILDVPSRSFILIHQGNYAGSKNPETGKSDILGCILVGKHHNDLNGDGIKDITHSISTLKLIMSNIKDTDKITIEIT